MNTVQHPNRRGDVINALTILAELAPDTVETWPGLTEAVHWLIDDTAWDQHDPATSIGTLLHDQQEATAINAVTSPLLTLLDELGPVRADRDYLAHSAWPQIRQAAAQTVRLLAENDNNRPVTGSQLPGPAHQNTAEPQA